MKNLLTLKRDLSHQKLTEYLHSRGDIFWSDADNAWIVTRYELAEKAYKSQDLSHQRLAYFAKRMPEIQPETIQHFIGVVSRMMVMSDKPHHQPKRQVCIHGLNQKIFDELKDKFEKQSKIILNQLSTKTKVNLLNVYIEPMTAFVLSELFSVPEDARREFYQSANCMTQFFGGMGHYDAAAGHAVDSAAFKLYRYFKNLIAERRQNPNEDFMTCLLLSQDRLGLDDEDLISQAIMMLVAGQITTSDQFSNNLHQILTHSDIKLPTEDEQTIPLFVEELTRLEPAVSVSDRIVKQDITLGDKQLKAGDVLLISVLAANRDDRIFKDPHDVKIHRDEGKHLSFGLGAHFCIGAKIARMEMQIMLRDLSHYFPNMRLNSPLDAERRFSSLAFSGFDSLTVET